MNRCREKDRIANGSYHLTNFTKWPIVGTNLDELANSLPRLALGHPDQGALPHPMSITEAERNGPSALAG